MDLKKLCKIADSMDKDEAQRLVEDLHKLVRTKYFGEAEDSYPVQDHKVTLAERTGGMVKITVREDYAYPESVSEVMTEHGDKIVVDGYELVDLHYTTEEKTRMVGDHECAWATSEYVFKLV